MSWSHRALVITVVGLLIVPLAISSPGAAGGKVGTASPVPPAVGAPVVQPDNARVQRPSGVTAIGVRTGRTIQATDERVTRVALLPNTDARWTIEFRTRLSTEGDLEEYRSFQRAVLNETARYLDPFSTRIRGVVRDAGNQTGREMTARNFTARTTIEDDRWGVVAFSFTWTNFATQSDSRLVVGDVYEGGYSLGPNESLVIAAPDGYSVRSVGPSPDVNESGVVRWSGPREFGDERPRVVLASTQAQTQVVGLGEVGGLPLVPVVVAGGVVTVVLAAAVLRKRLQIGV